ncbi:hypothetical protein [Pontibacter korlensis]|uniref:hypothetical protein n=1 Tax=Pontibacter korlensis TaxID=400092 RepID=UPI000B2437BC|nr:hypothetical protein [Pontibacter korlensis]
MRQLPNLTCLAIADEAIAKHVRFGNDLPTMLLSMHLYPIDGAVNRMGRHDTAFSFR